MGGAGCGTAPSRACVSWTIGPFPLRTGRWPRSPRWRSLSSEYKMRTLKSPSVQDGRHGGDPDRKTGRVSFWQSPTGSGKPVVNGCTHCTPEHAHRMPRILHAVQPGANLRRTHTPARHPRPRRKPQVRTPLYGQVFWKAPASSLPFQASGRPNAPFSPYGRRGLGG